MNMSREDLLQPSLANDSAPAAAPYSVRTTFLTGFFGGPFAAIAILATNSVRLRRVFRDLPVILVSAAVLLVGSWALQKTAGGAVARQWLDETIGANNLRYVYRLLALMIVGCGYLLHRQEQINSDLVGLKRPNGWIAGLICIVGGFVLLSILITATLR